MLEWYYQPMKYYWALIMPKRGTLEEAKREIARLKANPHPGPDCNCDKCLKAINRLLRIPTGDGSWITM